MKKSSKQKLVDRIRKRYGERWKAALSRDLGIDRATVKRIFNQRDDVPERYILAINQILESGQKA